MTPKNLARIAYDEWKALRRETDDHPLKPMYGRGMFCECPKCVRRRKLGAMLNLPYSGAPVEVSFRSDYQERN